MKDETRKWIEAVRQSGASAHHQTMAIYEKLVTEEHLFDKAFFGHRATRKQRKRLTHLWKLSMQLGGLSKTPVDGISGSPITPEPEMGQLTGRRTDQTNPNPEAV